LKQIHTILPAAVIFARHGLLKFIERRREIFVSLPDIRVSE
jgi:hypothetical protein